MNQPLFHILERHGMRLPEAMVATQSYELTDLFKYQVCTPASLAERLAQIFHLPLADWESWQVEQMPQGILDEEMMHDLHCLPLSEQGDKITVALSNPTVLPTLQKYLFGRGKQVQAVLAAHDMLTQQLSRLSEKNKCDMQDVAADYLERAILEAIQQTASDIHFEFYEHFARIRIRVDGQLNEQTRLPLHLKHSLIARIKVLSHLDIAEKRLPQDGRLRMPMGQGRYIDFRVSTLPCLNGEKIVLRQVGENQELNQLEHLGLEDEQRDLLLKILNQNHGMILVCGPTGSGKTRTLYHLLHRLNHEAVNIATVEDPIEIHLSGINQVQVNEKQGLNFALALRAFLRQDPDIIMVGEIRDFETADIAVKAAQTGHLLLSTLHTHHARSALTRLLNMGIAPFHLASAISLIMAQRLVRKLCSHCRQVTSLPPKTVLYSMGFKDEDFRQPWQLYRAKGCDACRQTGYWGRTGIFELLPISESIRHGLLTQTSEAMLPHLDLDLRRAGLLKVMRGETSLEEVLANT